MPAIGVRSLGLDCRVSEKFTPTLRRADTIGPEPNAEETRIRPVTPHARAVAIAWRTRDAAPRAEPALPPRSRVVATTGAVAAVLILATSGNKPRSRTL